MKERSPLIGAVAVSNGVTRFRVWAPRAGSLALRFPEHGSRVPMIRDEQGYHSLEHEAPPGTLYQIEFEDGRLRPDPASRAQPQGVHGPSMVVDPLFAWRESGEWVNPPLEGQVLYELHVATFTPEGTFEAIIPRLEHLKSLGITAIELMPIGQFPGERNWGYDGVAPYAAQWSYGGIDGLRRLANAAHQYGIGVILDVVYNHVGPEGNYLGEFGPYFNEEYATPWGAAVNLDGAESDHVREFFIQNALHWVIGCRVDGLRLDAVHAMYDRTAYPFLRELADRVRAEASRDGRRVLLIAESSDNDPRLVRSPEEGGIGFDAVWNDDYHHAVRTVLTGERHGYYSDFGRASQIGKALADRFVFAGDYCAGRRRRHGAPARDVPHPRFIGCTQNHDQVGNRARGDRLDAAAGLDGARVAAGLVLLAPFTPMLFMGEEFAAATPFPYFVSHSDPSLIEAVRAGRRREFEGFHQGEGPPTAKDGGWGPDPPDPQDEGTFNSAKLDWTSAESGGHGAMLAYYRELIRLRDRTGGAREPEPVAKDDPPVVVFRRGDGEGSLLIVTNMGGDDAEIEVPEGSPAWSVCLNSDDRQWGGEGRPALVKADRDVLRIGLPRRTLLVLTGGRGGGGAL